MAGNTLTINVELGLKVKVDDSALDQLSSKMKNVAKGIPAANIQASKPTQAPTASVTNEIAALQKQTNANLKDLARNVGEKAPKQAASRKAPDPVVIDNQLKKIATDLETTNKRIQRVPLETSNRVTSLKNQASTISDPNVARNLATRANVVQQTGDARVRADIARREKLEAQAAMMEARKSGSSDFDQKKKIFEQKNSALQVAESNVKNIVEKGRDATKVTSGIAGNFKEANTEAKNFTAQIARAKSEMDGLNKYSQELGKRYVDQRADAIKNNKPTKVLDAKFDAEKSIIQQQQRIQEAKLLKGDAIKEHLDARKSGDSVKIKSTAQGITAAEELVQETTGSLNAVRKTAALNIQAARASERIEREAARASRSGGGGGGSGGGGRMPPGPPGSPNGNLFGSDARGDRGGFVGRLKSVAEYTVAAQAVSKGIQAFSKGVSSVVEVQDEMQQLNKVLNTSKSNLDSLKNAAIDTAKEFGMSTKSVLSGFKVFAQQGLGVDEVKKMGRTVALASNVSEFQPDELAEIISTGMKTFGPEIGNNPMKLIDSFLAVEGKNAVSEKDLAEVMRRIGPQAKSAGISFDQLNAMTTVMKEQTRAPAEEMATSMKFITKSLFDPRVMASIEKALPGKIKFTNAGGDLRGGFDVLKDMSELFPTLDKNQQRFLANSVGGTRNLSKFIGLMNGFGKAGEVVAQGQNSAGEATQRNAIVMQSFSKQMQKTGAAFEGFAVAIGTNLLSPATAFLKTLTAAMNVLESMSKIKIPILSQAANAFSKLTGTADSETEGVSVGGMLGSLAMGAVTQVAIGKLLGGRNARAMENLGGTFGPAAPTAGNKLGVNAVTTGLATMQISNTVNTGLKGVFAKIGSFGLVQSLGGLLKTGATKVLGVAGAATIGGGLRTAGTAIGSFLGPLGSIIGFALSSVLAGVLEKAIGGLINRYFESGQERSQRTGVITEREKASKTMQDANDLTQVLTNMQNKDKQAAANKLATMSPEEQERKKEEGSIDFTEKDIKQSRKEGFDQIKKYLLENEDVIKPQDTLLGQVKNLTIDSNGDVLFKNKPIEQADPEELKSALNDVKKAAAGKKSQADLTVTGNSFAEAIAGIRKEDDKFTQFEDIRQRITEPGFSDLFGISKAVTPAERERFDIENRTGELSGKAVIPLLDKVAEAARNSSDPNAVAKAFAKVSEDSKNEIAKSLVSDPSEVFGAGRTDFTTHIYNPMDWLDMMGFGDESAGQDLQSFAFRKQFQMINAASQKLTDNQTVDFQDGQDRSKVVEGFKTADVGDFVRAVDKLGVSFAGKVQLDANGQKVVQLFAEQTKGKYGMMNVGQQKTMTVEEFATKFEANSIDLLKQVGRRADLVQGLDKDAINAGFGSTRAVNFKNFESGFNSILDMSDQMAGTFRGFGQDGMPQFNVGLQKVLQAATVQRDAKIERDKILEEHPDQTVAFAKSEREFAVQNEAAGVLAKAVEGFGRVMKSFESAVQKFTQFQAKQQMDQRIPMTKTGVLGQFGGEVPAVALGKEMKDLSAQERAAVALPNAYKKLSQINFQIGQFRDIGQTILVEKDRFNKILDQSSTGALSSFDRDALQKALQGNKDFLPASTTAAEAQKKLDEISNVNTPEKDREQAIKELKGVFNSVFDNQMAQNDAQAMQTTADQAGLETSIKTATALSQLQMSAEDAARSISNLKKFGGLFQNLDRAKGQGPFGQLGSQAPVAFTLNKGESVDQASQLDFSKMNSFEQQREMIRRLSSDDVRSGRVKILDANRQEMAPLNEVQRKARLKDIDIQEAAATKGQKEQVQREQLNASQQAAMSMANQLQETLDRNPNLTKKAKGGLESMIAQIQELGTKNPKAFLKGNGEINLAPFDILKTFPDQLRSLFPKDLKDMNEQEKKLFQQLGGNLETGEINPQEAAQAPITSRLDTANSYLQIIANAFSGGGGQESDSLKDKIAKKKIESVLGTPTPLSPKDQEMFDLVRTINRSSGSQTRSLNETVPLKQTQTTATETENKSGVIVESKGKIDVGRFIGPSTSRSTILTNDAFKEAGERKGTTPIFKSAEDVIAAKQAGTFQAEKGPIQISQSPLERGWKLANSQFLEAQANRRIAEEEQRERDAQPLPESSTITPALSNTYGPVTNEMIAAKRASTEREMTPDQQARLSELRPIIAEQESLRANQEKRSALLSKYGNNLESVNNPDDRAFLEKTQGIENKKLMPFTELNKLKKERDDLFHNAGEQIIDYKTKTDAPRGVNTLNAADAAQVSREAKSGVQSQKTEHKAIEVNAEPVKSALAEGGSSLASGLAAVFEAGAKAFGAVLTASLSNLKQSSSQPSTGKGVGGQTQNMERDISTFIQQQATRDAEQTLKIEQIQTAIENLEKRKVKEEGSKDIDLSRLATKDELSKIESQINTSTAQAANVADQANRAAGALQSQLTNLTNQVNEAGSQARAALNIANAAFAKQ